MGFKDEFKICWTNPQNEEPLLFANGKPNKPNSDYSQKLLELIAEATNECAEADGELTIGSRAVTKIDISRNGNSDEILSYSDLICSVNNIFSRGTGGEWY